MQSVIAKRLKLRDSEYGSTKITIWASLGLHIFVMSIGSFTFAMSKPKTQTISAPPIQVEFKELEDKTEIPPKKEEKKPEPEPIQETVPQTTEPPAPEPEKKEAAPPENKPEPEPVNVAKPVIAKKPEPKPSPAKEVIEKAREKKNTDSFNSVLKNLALEEPEEKAEAEGQEMQIPNAVLTRNDVSLSISEQDAIRQQLAKCWVIVPGARNAEDLLVEVSMTMNPDATVQSARILDQWKYNNNSFFRAAADSALRAVRNPKCSPLKLPLNKYEQWKKITIRFDPKDMF